MINPHQSNYPASNFDRQAYELIPLLNLLKNNGLDVDAFLASVEIPSFGITDPTYTISREREAQAVEIAAGLIDRPNLGLQLAKLTRLNNFSVYGLAIRCCCNIAEVLELGIRYRNLAWGNCDIHQTRDEDTTTTFFERGNLPVDRILVERDMACAALLMEEAYGSPIPLLDVHFTASEPDDVELHRDIFRCPLKFDQDSDSVRILNRVYDLPFPGADPLAKSFYEAQCATMSKALEKPFSYSETIKNQLYRTTPIPTLEEVAESLNMTPRTLQRRLKNEDTLFSELLLEVRQQRAKESLAKGGIPIERIAEALGFLDTVAFSHAFKKWTGSSPSNWKHTGVK